MQVFYTCTVADADAILARGWTDRDYQGRPGVHLSDQPLDDTDGFPREVVLCQEVPEELFANYEMIDDVPPQEALWYRRAILPAAALTSCPRPQVYDVSGECLGRAEVLYCIQSWQQACARDPQDARAQTLLRKAQACLDFLDRIDWKTLAPPDRVPSWVI
jgi:hypothetical protein